MEPRTFATASAMNKLLRSIAHINPIQPTAKRNIYNFLPDSVIKAIAEDRDVDLTITGKQGRKDMLCELDKIQPDWSIGIKSIEPGQVGTLANFKVFVLAAMYDIDVKTLMISENMGIENVVKPLKMLILRKMKRPDLIPDIQDHDTLVTAASVLGLRRSVARFCSVNELLRYIKGFGHVNISAETQRIADRYEMLNRLHSTAVEVLCTMYDMPGIAGLATIESHPLEKLIIEAFKPSADWQGIAKQIGMEIPIKANALRYLRTNIHEYIKVYPIGNFNRYGLLGHTDMDMMIIAGGYVSYSSRIELITKCRFMLSRIPTFFIPFYRTKSVNKETLMLTSVTDKDTFMIAYGHTAEFRIYEVDDLLQAFNYATNDKVSPFNFRKPEDHKHQFLIDEVENLFDLISPFSECKALSLRIAEGLRVVKFFNSRDNRLRIVSCGLQQADKGVLRTALIQIFESGMYMRKWDGTGPYPLELAATTVKVVEGIVFDRVWASLIRVEKTILMSHSSLNTIWAGMASLEFLVDRKSPPVRGEHNFLDLMFLTHKGKYCIRQASTLFVGTAIYYRWCLLGEDFGIEPSKVVRIS